MSLLNNILLGSSPGSAPPPQNNNETEDTSGTSDAGETGASSDQGSGASSGSTNSETTQAVKPTPVTASATKVELSSEAAPEPIAQVGYSEITDVDAARMMAEKVAAGIVQGQFIEAIGERPEVAQVGLNMDDLAKADDKEAGVAMAEANPIMGDAEDRVSFGGSAAANADMQQSEQTNSDSVV